MFVAAARTSRCLVLAAFVFTPLSLVLAAPPALPEKADYSPQLVGQWCTDAGLNPPETAIVETIAWDWQDAHDAWEDEQEGRIVDAMEATWALEPGSEAREAAAGEVYRLQEELVERQRAFVERVRLLIRLRGRWPSELVSRTGTPRTSRFAAE